MMCRFNKPGFWGMIALMLLGGCGQSEKNDPPVAEKMPAKVTFTKHIAPLVFEKCAACHRPGEVAPFSLLSYDDVRSHGTQIIDVTTSRYMPPWQPDAQSGPFLDDRRLSERQLALLARWVEQGMVEGDQPDLPAMPKWTDGWQLGEPDLVAQMPRAYELSAEGQDVFRNFILRVPITEARYVKTIEFRLSNRRVVHHASIVVDRLGHSRAMEDPNGPVGIEGMLSGQTELVDGGFLAWSPGRMPYAGRSDIGWLLEPGMDLVVLVHMLPTGKPEKLSLKLGIHFLEKPPKKHIVVFDSNSLFIDIPAGESEYEVVDDFTLPVDVKLTGVYPHAHYTGKEVWGTATLPDGTQRNLIHIPEWDFNWQEAYHYAEPVFLPRGSKLSMRIIYDNSADNPRNPNQPPIRITHGSLSSDEMASIFWQFVVKNQQDQILLKKAITQVGNIKRLDDTERMIAVRPDDPVLKLELALRYLNNNQVPKGHALIKQVIKMPLDDLPHVQAWALELLSELMLNTGQVEQALPHLRQAVKLAPHNPDLRKSLASALVKADRLDQAIAVLQQLVVDFPDFSEGYFELAIQFMANSKVQDALGAFKRTVELSPTRVAYLFAYANALHRAGQTKQAVAYYYKVIERAPNLREPALLLAQLLASHPDPEMRDPAASIKLAKHLVEKSRGRDPVSWDTLGAAFAATGQFESAIKSVDNAIAIAKQSGAVKYAEDLKGRRLLYEQSKPYITHP